MVVSLSLHCIILIVSMHVCCVIFNKVSVSVSVSVITNSKSYMSFQLVPKSVTLNDLERRDGWPLHCVISRSLSHLLMSFLSVMLTIPQQYWKLPYVMRLQHTFKILQQCYFITVNMANIGAVTASNLLNNALKKAAFRWHRNCVPARIMTAGGPGTVWANSWGPRNSVWSAGPIPLRWGPLTLNLGPCHLVTELTVQFCNAYDTTTILKVSICNETAAHLQNIAATLFHNSNMANIGAVIC